MPKLTSFYDTTTAATSMWTSDVVWFTGATTNGPDIQPQSAPKPPPKPKPETALAWLDRRVDEMRVCL